jgi:hypothetical protein
MTITKQTKLVPLADVEPGAQILVLGEPNVFTIYKKVVARSGDFIALTLVPAGEEFDFHGGSLVKSGPPEQQVRVVTPASRHGVACGHCSSFNFPAYHATVADVRACSLDAQQARAEAESEIRAEFFNEAVLTHGSADRAAQAIANEAELDAEDARRRAEPIKGEADVPDGVYTVQFVGGDYRTLRVETQADDADFAPGERIVSFLSGSDNTSSYTGFAFLKANGRVFPWKRFAHETTLIEAVRVLVADPKAASQAYGRRSEKCGICGRPLSTPPSLDRGIGPKCAADAGWL